MLTQEERLSDSNTVVNVISRLSDKAGSFGAVTAAMGCASCFPAIASLGASLGLGFLSQYEGLFINTLLPVFAGIALVSNIISGWFHRNPVRFLFGIAGPSMVLATLYLFWTDNWSTYMFYAGLLVMLTVSIWDIASPPKRHCKSNSGAVL
jgi:mercuric ion transport protein